VKSHRRAKFLFLGAALTACAALALLNWNAYRSAQTFNTATIEAQRQEDLRTALYRMEQRIAPLLARVLGRAEALIEESSPLDYRIDLVRGSADVLDAAAAAPVELARLAHDEASRGSLALPNPRADEPVDLDLGNNLVQVAARGTPRTNYEYNQRLETQNAANYQTLPVIGEAALTVGPLVSDWVQEAGEAQLVFLRSFTLDGVQRLQSFRVDWSQLESLLLGEVDDLFEGAQLLPATRDEILAAAAAAQLGATSELAQQGPDPQGDSKADSRDPGEGNLLVTIPARLVVPEAVGGAVDFGVLGPTTFATWALALAALVAASLAFRASQRDAARQRRFTSAVTHELRTPLTTFRMYSEMLSRDMVPPERRAEYLRTLEEESRRLSGLVENVLAHARLEDGAARTRREELTVSALLERIEAPLARRCLDAETVLAIDLGTAAEVVLKTDPEAVALILCNLVDNACKYGAPPAGHSPEAPIRLRVSATPGGVNLTIRDHGPGVSAGDATQIFQPFNRAGRDESDAAPGVGLGLALARDLARALDGDLVLLGAGPGGAFELRL
jgi:signal transduction histidine kinase